MASDAYIEPLTLPGLNPIHTRSTSEEQAFTHESHILFLLLHTMSEYGGSNASTIRQGPTSNAPSDSRAAQPTSKGSSTQTVDERIAAVPQKSLLASLEFDPEWKKKWLVGGFSGTPTHSNVYDNPSKYDPDGAMFGRVRRFVKGRTDREKMTIVKAAEAHAKNGTRPTQHSCDHH